VTRRDTARAVWVPIANLSRSRNQGVSNTQGDHELPFAIRREFPLLLTRDHSNEFGLGQHAFWCSAIRFIAPRLSMPAVSRKPHQCARLKFSHVAHGDPETPKPARPIFRRARPSARYLPPASGRGCQHPLKGTSIATVAAPYAPQPLCEVPSSKNPRSTSRVRMGSPS
jgi:hypothetical protein